MYVLLETNYYRGISHPQFVQLWYLVLIAFDVILTLKYNIIVIENPPIAVTDAHVVIVVIDLFVNNQIS